MEARELAADLTVLLVDFALAARELATELAAVLALAMLSVSPSSAPILIPLTRPRGGSTGGKDRSTAGERRGESCTKSRLEVARFSSLHENLV